MLLAHSPLDNLLSQALSGLEHGLFQGELGEQLQEYIISCHTEGKSAETLDHYSRRISDFFSFLTSYNPTATIQTITTHDVRLYILYLQKRGLAPATVNGHYRAVRTFFNWLVGEEIIKKSPLDNMKPPKVPDKERVPFSLGDIHRLLDLCRGITYVKIRNRALVLLFMDTGLRLAEMSNVQLLDMDITHHTIKVMGKGAKERYVKYGNRAEVALLEYLGERKKRFNDQLSALWLTEEGKVLYKRGVQETIKRLCHLAGITDTTPGPHSFRHFFATNLLMNGADAEHVQSLLGHATPTMTRHYSQTVNNLVAMANFERFSPVDHMKL